MRLPTSNHDLPGTSVRDTIHASVTPSVQLNTVVPAPHISVLRAASWNRASPMSDVKLRSETETPPSGAQ